MSAILAVAIGGAAGSVMRYVVSGAIGRTMGSMSVGTLAVNISGSLLLGFLARWFASPTDASASLVLALTVGLCGGYTTFSAFELDLFTLAEQGKAWRAFLYAMVSVVGCFAALVAGHSAARAMRAG
jgi:fluoride exporter